jgi:hypothetical protein
MVFRNTKLKSKIFNAGQYGILLAILFLSNVSSSSAQQAYFRSGRELTTDYFDSTKELPYLIKDMNRMVPAFEIQPLPLNDEVFPASNMIWSESTLLFQVDGTGRIRNPFLISDSYGNVHLFWTVISESPDELDLIYYMRLDAVGWTTPIDIVAATPIRAVNAAISQDGIIHLIWYGLGGISYSHAPIQEAENVKNWSEPVLLADSNTYASIVTAPSGNIYLAYPGVRNSGVFERVLEPNNLYWSPEKTISLNSLANTEADFVQIRVSSNNIAHVVWTELYAPDHWPPRGVFYARSVDGENWSAPILLAGDGFDQINIFVLDDNYVHVVWNGMAGVGGRYYRWSSDAGQTWSDTIEMMPAGSGGTEGLPQIVADQSGTLHILMAYASCPWYTYLENQRWVTPVCIAGEQARASNYIEEPALALSEGNKLHAVFFDDEKRLWYATKETGASWVPPQKLDNEIIQPVPSPILNDQLGVRQTPTIPATSVPADQQMGAPSELNFTPGQILIFSLSPVILLIIVLVGLQFYKRVR